MKDFISKEHYCYKIYTLEMKSHVTLPSIDNSSYMDYPPPFLEDHEPSPFYVFQKSQPPTPLYIRVTVCVNLNTKKLTHSEIISPSKYVLWLVDINLQ